MAHSWHTFTSWLHTWFSGLFAINPPVAWPYQWVYLALVIACFIGGIILAFWKTNYSFKQPLSSLLWTNFWIGIFLFFFRYQAIQILGMDIWRFIQEVAIVIWLFSIIRTYRRRAPQDALAAKVTAYRDRFLPKPKKKNSPRTKSASK